MLDCAEIRDNFEARPLVTRTGFEFVGSDIVLMLDCVDIREIFEALLLFARIGFEFIDVVRMKKAQPGDRRWCSSLLNLAFLVIERKVQDSTN